MHFDKKCRTSNCVAVGFFLTVRNCASCHSPPTSLLDCWPLAGDFKILSMKRRINQDLLDDKQRNSYGNLDRNVLLVSTGNHVAHFGVFFFWTGVLATLNLDKNACFLPFLVKPKLCLHFVLIQ